MKIRLLACFVVLLLTAGCTASRTNVSSYVWDKDTPQSEDVGFFASIAQQDMRYCRAEENYFHRAPTEKYARGIQKCMEGLGYRYIGKK